jgi:phosphatidate cytidylyltransferase
MYVGLPLAALLSIRALPQGMAWVYLLFANTWATDTFALIGGRLFGHRKLAPSISAGKTVEGAVIGLICGGLAGVAVVLLFGLPPIPAIIINPLLSCLTILGDLLASVFKRYYHVKDASHMLPGHGGFLDRIDGLILAAIPLYFVVLVMGAL